MWLAKEKRRCIITILSPVLLIASHALAQPDSSLSITQDGAKSTSNTATAEPTCESRTVNYITHTLPQQCLTSAPPAFSTPGSVSATITSTTDPTPSSSDVDHEEELDADGNDLSTGAFMSFEEWKAMMLEKSGQEALEPRNRKTKETHGEYPGDDFDSLGDEGEVSLDFDAYSDKISELASSTKPSQKEKDNERQVEKVSYDEGLAQSYRSKDAGTTCKERFSYASFDAGATIKKANPGAKNPKAILVENKDSYMLLECAMKNKFVIVELSDDILVDTVVIANFEFFSSMIRHFRVSVSDRYPVKEEKWKVLGTFQARNSRIIQPFLVENPQIWAKYLRIEILTHYGNEYYCPVSLLRVHGTRMLDSWKEADPADLEVEDDKSKTVSDGAEETVEVTEVEVEEVEVAEPPPSDNQVVNMEQSVFIPFWDKSYFHHEYPYDLMCAASDGKEFVSSPSEEYAQSTVMNASQPVQPTETTSSVNSGMSSSGAPTTQSASQTITDSGRTTSPSDSGEMTSNTTIESSSETVSSTTSSPDARSATVTTPATPTTITTPTLAKTANAQSSPKSRTPASTSLKPPSSRSVVLSKGQSSGSPTASRNKTGTATTSSPASAPTIQDSFFKALNKRIQALESNTTLSLQYIESQSRFLQEALARLERRQVAKVDLFLDTLNKTVLGELREVRTQYDQIWQSTVIALETQREQSEREIVALSSRLGVLADEVVFQKRMAIVQSVLLLGCLVLVIFSRGGIASVAADAYYPSERFLGAVSPSRLVPSPLFPSPPRQQQQSQQQQHTHHRPGADVPLLSVEEASPESRPRRSPSQTTESSSSTSLRHRPRRNSRATSTESTTRHRRPSTDSAPASTTGYFRAATPSSVDIGYDSEPVMTPTRGDENHGGGSRNGDGADYYATSGDDMAAGKSSMGASYSETLARKSERQLTPSSDVDGAEYVPLSSRPPLTHSTSARKPLPALPEDPD